MRAINRTAGLACGCVAVALTAAPALSALITTSVAGPLATAMPTQGRDDIGHAVQTRLETMWSTLAQTGDFDTAASMADQLFDLLITSGTKRHLDTFREVAFARRLIGQLMTLPESDRPDTLRYLQANPKLARSLAFLIETDEPAAVYATLNRLREAHGDKLDEYGSLAAALCVVHDGDKFVERINENAAQSEAPIELFEYFVNNEDKMYFGIRNVPAELLVHVVNTTASIPEMQWALNQFAGHDQVGRLFFTIEYDYDHFRRGTPKKVTQMGWNLPNIQQYGGVCADQAYFACTVGKSIGIPTAYTTGRGSDVGHAWVGYLKARNKQAYWDSTEGRYEEYQGVRGVIVDPQTRQRVPESTLLLIADTIDGERERRWTAAAMTDAAAYLHSQINATSQPGFAAEPPDEIELQEHEAVRSHDVEGILELIELGLRECPSYPNGWFAIRGLASNGELTLEHKKRWADILDRLCGKRYPDFSFAILAPMIQSVDDVEEQNKFWNAAFREFRHRNDLAAEVRILQAEMWLEAGNNARAGQCYEDIINRFPNDGHHVVDAVVRAEQILRDSGNEQLIVPLYQQAFSKISKPSTAGSPFVRQSNWFRVGERYAAALAAAGETQRAAEVREELGIR